MTPFYNKRLDLKQLAIDKLDKVAKIKFPIIKTDKIYFEKPIGEISSIIRETSYQILIRTNGTRVFPRAIDGKYLIQMINELQNNKFFGYIDHEGQKCKIKQKIKCH